MKFNRDEIPDRGERRIGYRVGVQEVIGRVFKRLLGRCSRGYWPGVQGLWSGGSRIIGRGFKRLSGGASRGYWAGLKELSGGGSRGIIRGYVGYHKGFRGVQNGSTRGFKYGFSWGMK